MFPTKNIYTTIVQVAAILAIVTSSPINNLRQDNVPNGLVFMGATSDKEILRSHLEKS